MLISKSISSRLSDELTVTWIWILNESFFTFQIDQSVFTVCPSRPDMRPGMILVFELFILRGAVTPTDKVVGWACFPICDGNFNVIEGK